MQHLLSAVAVSMLTLSATAQLNVVIPAGTATVAGNSSNAFPWGNNASAFPGLRLMCVYGAVNFTAQSISTPILITQLKWRPDNAAAAVAGGTYTPAVVELSTSPTGFAAVTTNYATNHGANRTVGYSGPVVHTPTPGPGAWTPQSWCVDITLTTPFLYDPSAGDLVIDVDYVTGSFTGGGVGQMDVQSTNANAARIFASSMYPVANGITQSHGVVVEVGYAPPAGYAFHTAYGSGCNAPSPLALAASARPVLGTTIALNVNNIPASSAIGSMLYGLTEFPAGLSLTSLGMPGCSQYVTGDATLIFVVLGPSVSTNFVLPSNPAFSGVTISTQAASLSPGVNPLGVLASNGVRLVLGIN